MKIGAENNSKIIILVALLALAGFIVYHSFLSSPSPDRASAVPANQQKDGKQGPLLNSLDPSLRLDLLKASADVTYKGTGRNIFKAEPDPPPVPKVIAPAFVGPPMPPPPPPINLKFYGFASQKGEPKKVFLAEGDDIFIAKQGDIVDRHYKIDSIGANSVDVEDVLNNNRQTIYLSNEATGPGGPS